MNRYPAWKYILLIAVISFGLVYAVPNLFGDDPAVQVSSARGFDLEPGLIDQVSGTLESEGLAYRGIETTARQLLVRFDDVDRQLRAQDILREQLGDQYVVALNLAPATPGWLRVLNASPMTLGLDLQGGVHFLMQVDMETARQQRLEHFEDEIRNLLRDQRIRYRSVRVDRGAVQVQLRSDEDREQARRVIGQHIEALELEPRDGSETFNLRGTVGDDYLQELQDSALDQNISALRTRVNELGVSEPVIQRQGADRIVVQLPGVQDTAQAKLVLGATATLEYRAVDEENDPYQAQQSGRIPPQSRLYMTREGEPILLSRRVIARGDNVIGASAGFDQRDGSPSVSVRLDAEGGRSMRNFTIENVGNRMGVVYIEDRPEVRVIDGEEVHTTRRVEEVISAARIREPFGSNFQTTGLGSAQEAGQLALLLRSGALAAPMSIIEERTVGPSMGRDSIEQGFRSVVIGFFLVLLVMAVYYRVFGLVANVALTANLVLIVALMSMLGFTLTLPGIAGIVLTVGMAVDANVLIFERIREELRNGNTPQAAIRAGYEKVFSTIADANVTTVIAAIVLFMFGTGPIKGFAITLTLGIICSMFTAILGTRAIINLIYGGRRKLQALSI